MKTVASILFFGLTFYVNYVCAVTFFDYFSIKINEIGEIVNKGLSILKNKVKFLLYTSPDESTLRNTTIVKEKMIKKFYDGFVEEVVAEVYPEGTEFTNLKFEPTALMSTSQLAALHGRRIESHIVTTKDGYMLTLHHVLTNSIPSSVCRKNQTILIYHGLLGSSADWVMLGGKKSLPYILSDAGCDVWLGNARGNYYSRGHVTLKVETKEFWKFSWHEIGIYDLSAITDYIRKYKNSTAAINFIGHSMGATAFLVLLSSAPQYNHYFRMGILLAPLVFMSHTQGPLRTFAHMLGSHPSELLAKLIGNEEFMPTRKVPKWAATKYCHGPLLYCSNPLLFLSGSIPIAGAWNTSLAGRILYHVPAGGSANTIKHYMVLIKSGKFHKFGDISSEYHLNSVTLPLALISSSEDRLATTPDVLKLYFSVANPIDHYIIRGKNISHVDFLWGSHIESTVYDKVIDYLEFGLDNNPEKINSVYT